jgi:hypothetical protein
MNSQEGITDPNDETPESLVETRQEMAGSPELMEKQHPSAPLAFVMGAYPIILIFLLLTLAAYFVMSTGGTSNDDPGSAPATEVPIDPNPANP